MVMEHTNLILLIVMVILTKLLQIFMNLLIQHMSNTLKTLILLFKI